MSERINITGLDKQSYKNTVKEVNRKGHSFTTDKYGKRTLVKKFQGKFYEYVKGKRSAEVVDLSTFDNITNVESVSYMGKAIQLTGLGLERGGLYCNEMWRYFRELLEEGNGSLTEGFLAPLDKPRPETTYEDFIAIVMLCLKDVKENRN